jgi:hypothetical protein
MYIYCDEDYEMKECAACKEQHDQIGELKYWFKGLLEVLYSNDFDVEDFEGHLEEIAASLEMKVPSKDIVLTKKNAQDVLLSWINWNNK